MPTRRVLAALFFLILTTPLLAAPADLATLVRDAHAADDATFARIVGAALDSSDPAVRAVAARLVATRNSNALLASTRANLATETNAEVVRELMRAVALNGGTGEFSQVRAAAARFDPLLNADLADLLGRIGGSESMAAWFALEKQTAFNDADRRRFFRLALWGRQPLVTPTAARVLGAGFSDDWSAILRILSESELPLDRSLAILGLSHSNESIELSTATYLFELFVKAKARDAEALASEIEQLSKPATPAVAFSRELLERLLVPSRQKVERDEWTALLRGGDIAGLPIRVAAENELLTPHEMKVAVDRLKDLKDWPLSPVKKPQGNTTISTAAPFTLFERLPAGAVDALKAATRCDGDIVGYADVAVDAVGRVTQVATDRIYASPHCREFLREAIPLGLATNRQLGSARATSELLIVRSRKASFCVDESSVSDSFASWAALPRRPGHNVNAPRVVKRVDPEFTDAARRALKGKGPLTVLAEAVITRDGCIRDARMLTHSDISDLNRAVLLAISQWTFEPGTLEGEPVEVLFNFAVTFTVN